MSYKSTSENLNHLQRVASASTRPHANGRIDLIPENARPPEEYYRSIRDQYVEMNERFQSEQSRLEELSKLLRQYLPADEYRFAKIERDNLAERHAQLQEELIKLRPLVHAAGSNAYGTVFSEVAKRLLDRETYIKLQQEVKLLLGRDEYEIKLRSRGTESRRQNRDYQRRKRQEKRVERIVEAGQ